MFSLSRNYFNVVFLIFVIILLLFFNSLNFVVSTISQLSPLSSSDESQQFVQEVLLPEDQNYCKPNGLIKDTCCDYQSVESIQGDMFPKVEALVKSKFFKYYKLNLWRECPFWNDDGLCMNRDCSVQTTDESLLPEEWRQEALGAIQMSPKGSAFQPFKVCTYKDQDFCAGDDPTEDMVYVNLLDNPERFTGYTGPSAAKVWKAIYEENCFNIVHKMSEGCPTCSALPSEESSSNFSPLDGLTKVPSSKAQLGALLQDLAEAPDDIDHGDDGEVCLEKRVYYRLISGLHSSISIHICDEYFDRTTGKWGPNLECFVQRIGAHPERLGNIYFTYALVLRAVTKLDSYLAQYPFQTGDQIEDEHTRALIRDLISSTKECPATFDETTMFKGPDARSLYLEFRDHFRNVSRIMDCVGCEKCRLWGKVQTTGLGTALKVLFAYEEKSLHYKSNPNLLNHNEIVALFNTLNRLSESLEAIQKFRKLYYNQLHPPVSQMQKVSP
ncbi:endoplasmic reticulum Oxidoreductin 1-domain-containing protein [Halteromyces radiatus]|uniref:endoplasmic reticulum Oxidoreductin 1-domain-containing protein n=1 Tax=Halteromyces radiatus TaxID=101107 RepID=UPI00221EE14C|nr:endoplasmic reticulum Oxidoreductin 1-domain-containing protein [Halteromyces radiatus]KAI8089114.1 endoplasmic reticulum Oxidoreductin 1-domain-containing protein [Halteromyces radiatus]